MRAGKEALMSGGMVQPLKGIWGDFRMGLVLVAWDLGWGRGGVLTKYSADRICLKKR